MKIKLNRNILWTSIFADTLAELGVKYATVSPGSRNTPLTFALAKNNNLKKFIHVDERSAAFFALGLAKASKTAVLITCTSGTAAAEFYPAIIEAYQQRIPLIVCSADRPPELRNRGANQTINQINLYNNYVKLFIDTGMPEATLDGVKKIKKIAEEAFITSFINNPGPVHINFPFDKPFEPDSFTDEVDAEVVNFDIKSEPNTLIKSNGSDKAGGILSEIKNNIVKSRCGLILVGPGSFDNSFKEKIRDLSLHLDYPIFADGASQLRFGSFNDKIINNYEPLLRYSNFRKRLKPEIILFFGRTMTSKAIEEFLNESDVNLYNINEQGDCFDPANKGKGIIPINPTVFCEEVIKSLPPVSDSKLMIEIQRLNSTAEEVKGKTINKGAFPSEGRIIKEVIDSIPSGSHLMLSNSMPVRDFDYFAPLSNKDIAIYTNRGASGIDGIISTALGISGDKSKNVYLLTGDLAFYYDITALSAAAHNQLNLTIILINNNGGGIFEVLPISEYKEFFNEYFKTPHNIDFSPIVAALGGNFVAIENWDHLREELSLMKEGLNIFEVRTDAKDSLSERRYYWEAVAKEVEGIKTKMCN
jgi:2-succinyl-5-enolpyruvyl-6-hydroxy-3-cyclohexene-1-carboxylate synthase